MSTNLCMTYHVLYKHKIACIKAIHDIGYVDFGFSTFSIDIKDFDKVDRIFRRYSM